MTLSIRIKERAINALLVGLVFLTTGIYSCFAQSAYSSVNYTDSNPASRVKNAGNKIRHVQGINLQVEATPLQASINSAYHEIKPTLAPCGNRLYFSRVNHPLNTGGMTDQEDIWYAAYDTLTQEWSEPIRMPGQLNTAGPNFVNNVSTSGDTIILGNRYLKNGKMKAGLSYSVNKRGQWSQPITISIQDDYNMSKHDNRYVSLKSGVIISSVQRADTYGERDLYVSFWNGTSGTIPVNMGGVINTEYEESSPFLADDLKTLYFASKGHNGYGGYDIFVTRRLDDSWTNWSEPENLGPAVNSTLDDEFFSISSCGGVATFSRQVNVHNVDLYKISMDDLFLQRKKKKNMESGSALASL
ncbi:MAG: PD40 domain-containing protein [Cyclobacteriaceae bacterium]|nr:PD40 domain-containing protein [Cyclobacteriaceae bacterium]